MGIRIYTDEQIQWLKDNCKNKFTKGFNQEFNEKFNLNLSYTAFKSLLFRNEICLGRKPGICPPQLEKIKLLTSAELEIFKKNNPGKTAKEMSEFCLKTFKKNITPKQVKGIRNRHKMISGLTGYFPKGHVPQNKGQKGIHYPGTEKTWFKKGSLPSCTLPINTEIIDGDGYTKIKIAMPNKWIFKHRLIYEQHFGQIPKNHVIIFKDGNKQNFDLENLMLISKSENLKLNKGGYRTNSPEFTEAALAMLQLQEKLNEIKH